MSFSDVDATKPDGPQAFGQDLRDNLAAIKAAGEAIEAGSGFADGAILARHLGAALNVDLTSSDQDVDAGAPLWLRLVGQPDADRKVYLGDPTAGARVHVIDNFGAFDVALHAGTVASPGGFVTTMRVGGERLVSSGPSSWQFTSETATLTWLRERPEAAAEGADKAWFLDTTDNLPKRAPIEDLPVTILGRKLKGFLALDLTAGDVDVGADDPVYLLAINQPDNTRKIYLGAPPAQKLHWIESGDSTFPVDVHLGTVASPGAFLATLRPRTARWFSADGSAWQSGSEHISLSFLILRPLAAAEGADKVWFLDATDGLLKQVAIEDLPVSGGTSGTWTRVEDSAAAVAIGDSEHEELIELTHDAGAITVTLGAATAADKEGGILKATGQTVNIAFQAAQGGGAGAKAQLPDGTLVTNARVLLGFMTWKVLQNSDGDSAVYLLEGHGKEVSFRGSEVSGNLAATTASSMTLAVEDSGKMITTTGNVTIPTNAGFNVTLVAGGAHTVGNGTVTSAAMAAGDVMSVFNDLNGDVHAALVAAADKVAFS